MVVWLFAVTFFFIILRVDMVSFVKDQHTIIVTVSQVVE